MNTTESNSIAVAVYEEAYQRLLERPDVKKALFRLEIAQAKHDSVSRKLGNGSSVVSLDDLSFLESELVAAKADFESRVREIAILKEH